MTSNNAIVPFSPFHASHMQSKRTFHFGSKSIVIEQQWKPDGKGGTNLGFGAHVYDAALVYNKKIVELGCGTGLVSIAAASFGASHIVATDGDPQSVALTQSNIDANTANFTSTIEAKTYLGQDLNGIKHCDLLLGADIIACPYEQAYDDLLASLRHFIQTPTAMALIAYKPRHGSEVKFFHKLKKYFDYDVIPDNEYHADFRYLQIQLLRIVCKSNSL
ncbi:hypothetical protein THRCLA_08835 [Thraustotheca clavata]|uniref:Methyltransferase n=1 Tax=Thraustotheca clavata TaxID=74557 RepID=A0A1V9Z1R7_9STRA|nr:hypothetical protein THRCLA_08835 [Thraustotheca clavata]